MQKTIRITKLMMGITFQKLRVVHLKSKIALIKLSKRIRLPLQMLFAVAFIATALAFWYSFYSGIATVLLLIAALGLIILNEDSI